MIPDTSSSAGGGAPGRRATTLTASPAVPGRPSGCPCRGRSQLLQCERPLPPGHGRPRYSSPARLVPPGTGRVYQVTGGHHSARAAQSSLRGMLVAIPAPGYALRKVEEKPGIAQAKGFPAIGFRPVNPKPGPPVSGSRIRNVMPVPPALRSVAASVRIAHRPPVPAPTPPRVPHLRHPRPPRQTPGPAPPDPSHTPPGLPRTPHPRTPARPPSPCASCPAPHPGASTRPGPPPVPRPLTSWPRIGFPVPLGPVSGRLALRYPPVRRGSGLRRAGASEPVPIRHVTPRQPICAIDCYATRPPADVLS